MKTFFWQRLAFCLLWALGLAAPARGQAPGIALGKTELAPGMPFTITVSAPEDFGAAPAFPDIAGMQRAGTSSSSSTTIVNGQVSSTYSITQRYVARAEGKFTLKPFGMKVNGKVYKSPGATIVVSKNNRPDDDPANAYDPLEEFFGRRRDAGYRENKENAFLALETTKTQVWVGEGFTLHLSLYVAEDNRADMDFYDLTNQLTAITKQIKPANCWEESFGITNIEPRSVTVNGKPYKEYRIWESAFYPLNAKPIRFGALRLQMIKYDLASDPFFGGLDRQQSFISFASKPLAIQVKELPPSPYSRALPVGDFKLVERIGKGRVETGQSVSYQFVVKGEGNIAAIEMPTPPTQPQLDIYPPTTQQNILRDAGRVTGSKTFTYLLQPRQAGRYKLRQVGFTFPFFNPRTGRYDSLQSEITLTAFGNAAAGNTPADEGDYLSNTLLYLDANEGLKLLGNVALLALALATGGAMLWRRRR